MVECEFWRKPYAIFNTTVLIDTWWNVNKFSNASFLHAKRVLIDTWWNVNTLLHEPLFRTDHVLIDTWWNVNLYQNGTMRIKQTSFNRYMVECE